MTTNLAHRIEHLPVPSLQAIERAGKVFGSVDKASEEGHLEIQGSTGAYWGRAMISLAGIPEMLANAPAAAPSSSGFLVTAPQNRSIGSSPNASSRTPAAYAAVEERLNQLQLQTTETLRILSWQVSQLSDQVSKLHLREETHQVGSHYLTDNDVVAEALNAKDPCDVIGHKIEGDCWADLFDAVAEHELRHRADLVDFAVGGLSSTDASVRSSAARALAVLSPSESIPLLKRQIENEKNTFVRASFKAALDAATLESA